MTNKPKHLYILLFSFLILIFSMNSFNISLPEFPFIIAGTQEQKACTELGCLKISDKTVIHWEMVSASLKCCMVFLLVFYVRPFFAFFASLRETDIGPEHKN